MSATRFTFVVAFVIVASVALAPAALADAAGPTDYQTEIVSVEPAVDAITVEMIGGDSFMSLELIEPAEVIVIGYRGEPYLRFDPDGTIYENRRSPSAWLNQDRYGTGDPPDYTDPTASPEWIAVGENGRYAWHDHRSHWMLPILPLGKAPGDIILEATVPLLVDGLPVTVGVESTWLEAPSWWPMILGGVAGLVAVGAALRVDRRQGIGPLAVALAIGAAALILGSVAYRSVPAETGPSPLLWLLPAIAVGAAAVALVVRRRLVTTVYLDGLTAMAGAGLAYWGISRSDGLRRALIPSDAPATLDRFLITAALVAGAAILLVGLAGLARPKRLDVV